MNILELVAEHPGTALIVFGVLLFGFGFIKSFVTTGGNALMSVIGGFSEWFTVGSAAATTITADLPAAIKALHTVVEYAIETGDPTLVQKVTNLYTQITAAANGTTPTTPTAAT